MEDKTYTLELTQAELSLIVNSFMLGMETISAVYGDVVALVYGESAAIIVDKMDKALLTNAEE